MLRSMSMELSESIAAIVLETAAAREARWKARQEAKAAARAARKVARDAGLKARHARKLARVQLRPSIT